MNHVPRSALLLGWVCVVPFLWGLLCWLLPGLSDWTIALIGSRFVAPYLPLYYGTILLAFQGGVLWGFASRGEGEAVGLGYGISLLPVLWAFLFTGIGPGATAFSLMAGFLAVLGIDLVFWRSGLTPRWWMAFRWPMTAVVVACLAVIGFSS